MKIVLVIVVSLVIGFIVGSQTQPNYGLNVNKAVNSGGLTLEK